MLLESDLVFSLAILAIAVLLFYLVAIVGWLALRLTRFLKIREAREYIQRFNSADMLVARSYMFKAKIEDYSSLASPSSDDEIEARKCVLLTLNFFEEMAISIEARVVDDDFLKDYFRGTLLTIYEKSEGFVLAARKTSNNEAIYRHLERLKGRWEFSEA